MLKALAYLKDDLENIDPRKLSTIQYLKECIKELEELENRSCDGCKFGKFGADSIGIEVECSLNWECKRGNTDKWEPKQ